VVLPVFALALDGKECFGCSLLSFFVESSSFFSGTVSFALLVMRLCGG
jgi:hypothetical protein